MKRVQLKCRSFCQIFTCRTLSDTLEGPGPIRVFWGTLMGLAREGGGTTVIVDILNLLLEEPTEIRILSGYVVFIFSIFYFMSSLMGSEREGGGTDNLTLVIITIQV